MERLEKLDNISRSGSVKQVQPNQTSSKSDSYDAQELSRLLQQCKGNRTTADFSRVTGTSITYLTKLLNGNSPSRPSKKFLLRIAYPEYAAGESKISYVELLNAAGYGDQLNANDRLPEESYLVVPEFARKKSFPISFMIDNLLECGEIDYAFNIHNADSNGWFVIESKESRILCVPAIFNGKESKEKKEKIAFEFMVAITSQPRLNSYYILTNQKSFSEEIKSVLPRLPKISLTLLKTDDYQKISERQLVY